MNALSDTAASLTATIHAGADVLLRPSTERDIPAITAIYGVEVQEGSASFEVTPPDEAEMAARREKLVSGGFPYLVAEVGGEIAGYAYAGPYRPRPAYGATLENSIYVSRAFHRRGVARLLMRRLLADCEALGYRQMIAVIGDSANRASIDLHASVGFEHVGTLRSVGWKHGKWLDSVLMQRALGPGDSTPR